MLHGVKHKEFLQVASIMLFPSAQKSLPDTSSDWQSQFNTTDVIESKGVYNGWYYVKKRQLQTEKETVEQNSTGWWYIGKDGKVDFSFTGIASNAYGPWYNEKGKVNFSKNMNTYIEDILGITEESWNKKGL